MNDVQFLQHTQKEILKYCPAELSSYELDTALTFQILFYYRKTFTQMLKVLFSAVLRDQYKITTRKGKEEILFFYGSDYIDRRDYKERFDKVVSLCDSCIVIEPKKSFKIRWRHLFRMGKVLKWSWKYRHSNMDINLRQYLVHCMFEQYCRLQDIIKYTKNMNQLKLFICWCDTMHSDFIVSKYFKTKGIRTATLQHGFFNMNHYPEKMAVVNSPSDDFLCWNQVMLENSRNITGIMDKWKVVGSPEFIGRKVIKKATENHSGYFGVALSAFTKAEENKRLLSFAHLLIDKFDFQCILRPHPSLKEDDYREILKNEKILWKKDESFHEFLCNKEFVLVGESGIFPEIVYNMTPFFHYVKDYEKDVFAVVHWNRFHTEEELINLYLKFKQDFMWMENGLNEAKRMLLTEESPEILYKKYFDEVLTSKA